MERETFPLSLAPALVRDFVIAHQEYTEAPDEFLAIVPIFVGSVLAGRWFEFNGQFLSNYYLIVGPTGTAKKTTAQSLSMKILRGVKRVNLFQQYHHINSTEDDKGPEGPSTAYPLVTHFSIEGLQSHAIGEGTSTAIQMGEYGTLFQVGKRQSQQNTISELTNMYDGNLISVKTVSRSVHIESYAISILGASTKSWLEDFCSGKNISGGFVNRHLVVTGKPSRILPKPKQLSELEWDDFINRFSDLIPTSLLPQIEYGQIQWTGRITSLLWSADAETIWNEYYQFRVSEMRRISSSLLTELSARELTHATKLMGLSAFLDRRCIVNLRDLEFGIRFARWSIQNVITMMTSDESPRAEAGQKVLNKLNKTGPMSKTDLARALGGQQKDINKAIWHMIIDEILEECPDGLLRINAQVSNSQLSEIDKFFGKTDIYEISKKNELKVETPPEQSDSTA